jgi:hypothetical protein
MQERMLPAIWLYLVNTAVTMLKINYLSSKTSNLVKTTYTASPLDGYSSRKSLNIRI